jgi:hypothetical protein
MQGSREEKEQGAKEEGGGGKEKKAIKFAEIISSLLQ